MKHRLLHTYSSKDQKEHKKRIREARFSELGLKTPEVPWEYLAEYNPVYEHENECESCGARIRYQSYSKEIDFEMVFCICPKESR